MLGNDVDANTVKNILNESLQKSDNDYKDIKMMLGRDPLRVTLLPKGAFNHFKDKQNTMIKMNPSQQTIETLMNCS